jgi:hypothetical protein
MAALDDRAVANDEAGAPADIAAGGRLGPR